MRAVLREDMILHITQRGDTEIGDMIPGVGLERLRFDGKRLVDLAMLDEIWVRHLGGAHFELHAVEVLNSQLVQMTYRDRKRLHFVDGSVVLRTPAEQNSYEHKEQTNVFENAELRQELRKLVESLTPADVNTHVETVFRNLNEAQKTSLKRLYKVVLFLAKNRS